jgi:dTDP-glucose 4,6-dehydratase
MNVTTSNCSNNYGPKQHAEKLIPTIIRNCLNLSPIPIYGNGKNIRDWLYVTDHAKAIDLIFMRGTSGETYNVGGHNERTNLEITHAICTILDGLKPRADGKSYADLITFVKDRAGHDLRYAIDPEKITETLGYKPDETFDTGILKTVKWYVDRA